MYVRNDAAGHEEHQRKLDRAAYEYGFTKARMLRDLGYEPRLTSELCWLLFEEFEERHGAALDIEDLLECYLPNFAEGFLDEAVSIEGPRDPGERSHALYLVAAAYRERDLAGLGDQVENLARGPHGDWASREAGRTVGTRPNDLPAGRPGPEGTKSGRGPRTPRREGKGG